MKHKPYTIEISRTASLTGDPRPTVKLMKSEHCYKSKLNRNVMDIIGIIQGIMGKSIITL